MLLPPGGGFSVLLHLVPSHALDPLTWAGQMQVPRALTAQPGFFRPPPRLVLLRWLLCLAAVEDGGSLHVTFPPFCLAPYEETAFLASFPEVL